MAKLSDIIESYINRIIEMEKSDSIEIQRNILAQQFNCAPSQINYVLATRFSNDKGYIIESRRGGGGYVRIFKIKTNPNRHIEKILKDTIGDSLTKAQSESILKNLFNEKIINERELNIMLRVLSDRTLGKIYHEDRNMIRADLMKEMLLVLI
ncbi:MAG: CtsR family transcriptional regulator [Tissierellales bacterium]|nr:CtsR family transcriptional regulator [Tissierellales bacterium]MBN2827287.1 CtsR family transcriptional regulator [Tissierellales bacterium]